jgi:alkylation response protein AidB-like acyl-CoA dehydrogenase
LVPEDFLRLADAGYPLTAVPAAQGGAWQGARRSTKLVCDLLRVLAGGDPSVALVSAMHPAVLAMWLATEHVEREAQSAWDAQRRFVFETASLGCWWGTITSEPGSGGDIANTKAIARRTPDGSYRFSGSKHFGSGSGIASYMITTAVPEGESEPDLFFLNVKDVPWDGSTGMRLVAPWDGSGMAATQSHAFAFTDFPATRSAWPGHLRDLLKATGGFIPCAFTAVIVGIVETAHALAFEMLYKRAAGLRPYEQVEWTRIDTEVWLIRQAYEGMLRAVETDRDPSLNAARGKLAVADLAESALGKMCRVLGGGTYSHSSPFSHWYEDVRALGFLRPPWGLAYDHRVQALFEQP